MDRKFITPVAMRITAEQYFEDLEKPLKELGYYWGSYNTVGGDIQLDYDILATNYYARACEIGGVNKAMLDNNNRIFIEDYNPELFLALAAMQKENIPIVGEYVIGNSSDSIPNDVISKVTSVKGRNFSVDGRVNACREQTSMNFCRKATVGEIMNNFKQKHNMKENFSIEGSVALKRAFAEESGMSFYSHYSINENLTSVEDSDKLLQGCGVIKYSQHFVLPKDYEKALEYVRSFYGPEFKIGDLVVVLPEDEFYHNSEKRAQKITQITETFYVLEFQDGTTNAYTKIRHATPEEIEEYENPKLPVINGYSGELRKQDGAIVYGCAHLDLAWFKSSFNRSIETLTLSSGVTISKEQIKQIRNYINKNNL